MTTRLWDRAAVAVAADGRRFPAVAALGPGEPTVQALFDFMRDAELRFATLRMRILERVISTRGEDTTQIDVMLRHPGHARVTTSRPGEELGGTYEIWISDGDIVRTYAAQHKLGTQRPIRNRPRGLDDKDFPGKPGMDAPAKAEGPGQSHPLDVPPELRCGVVRGTVVKADPKGRLVLKTHEGEEAFMPHWRGGMPAEGGGLDQAMVAQIAKLSPGQQVEVEWEWSERKRCIRIAPAR